MATPGGALGAVTSKPPTPTPTPSKFLHVVSEEVIHPDNPDGLDFVGTFVADATPDDAAWIVCVCNL